MLTTNVQQCMTSLAGKVVDIRGCDHRIESIEASYNGAGFDATLTIGKEPGDRFVWIINPDGTAYRSIPLYKTIGPLENLLADGWQPDDDDPFKLSRFFPNHV